jgi:Fe-S-cluster containining protein
MNADKIYISHLVALPPYQAAFWLLFQCKRCGDCCNAFDGVKLTGAEMRQLKDKYRVKTPCAGKDYYLRQPCPLWQQAAGCTAYADRPRACRAFPLYVALCTQNGAKIPYLAAYHQCPSGVEALKALEKAILAQDLSLTLAKF